MTLGQAAKRWAAMPARARKEAIAFFRGEAKQSDDWANEAGFLPFGEPAPHRQDARALRAAVALLVVAGRKA